MSETVASVAGAGPQADEALRASGAGIHLPGFDTRGEIAFRRWRDASDLQGFVEVINASWAADGIQMRTGPDEEGTRLRHSSGFDLEADLVLAERAGRIVGYARTDVDPTDDGGRRHWVSVMVSPDGRREAMRTALYGWAEDRQRERAGSEPASAHTLAVWVNDGEAEWRAFLESRGYRPVRWFTEMVRETLDDLPARPVPAGLEVRPVHPEDVPTILRAKSEAFEDHWGHSPLTDTDIRAVLEHPQTDLTLWAVAWDGEEVAGVVIAHDLPEDNAAFGWQRGWLASVATRRPWRGRGLASALCVRAMEQLRDRGLTSAGLGVDTENPSGALAIYERLGFRTDIRAMVMERSLDGRPGDG
jgi:mycothiol synthase